MRSRKYLRAEPYGTRSDEAALIAGADEAGCGPLAGPVVAAAVILDRARPIRGLNDSKQLSAEVRERLDRHIRAKAICYAVAEASVDEIDTLNIYHARMLALQRAVEALAIVPTRVLVDGNRAPRLSVAAQAIVGGDARIQSISAASILAKVHRDRLCHALHREHPQYGFASHKGYSTPEHLAALRRHGACVHHRRSFAPVRRALGLQIELELETGATVRVEMALESRAGPGVEIDAEAAIEGGLVVATTAADAERPW